MAYSVLSQGDNVQYNLKQYVCDKEIDLNTLPVSAEMGSTAFIIETGKKYILNSAGQWVGLTSTTSSGGIIDTSDEYRPISIETIDSWFNEGDEKQ